MIRKILLIASAIAIPLGATAVTAVNGSTSAGAVSVPIVCHPTGTLGVVTWAAPGLTLGGTVSASPTSSTTTTAQTLNCGALGGGTAAARTGATAIVTSSTVCTGPNLPLPGCAAGLYNHSSISGLAGNSGTLWNSLPTVSWKIGTTNYTMSSSSSNTAAGCIALGEIGFTIHGTITTGPAARMGHAAKYVACFSTDAGPGTTGSFTADLGNPTFGGTIVTAVLSANGKLRVA